MRRHRRMGLALMMLFMRGMQKPSLKSRASPRASPRASLKTSLKASPKVSPKAKIMGREAIQLIQLGKGVTSGGMMVRDFYASAYTVVVKLHEAYP